MAGETRQAKTHVDSDGVRIQKAPGVRAGVWLLVLAMALVGIAVFVILRPTLQQRSDVPADAAARHVTASAAQATRVTRPASKPLPPRVAVDESAALPAAAPANPQSTPAHDPEPMPPNEDASAAAEGAPEELPGIAVFPPPGTKPIKRGIVVPENFELPPGYVRHYQATDDGKRVPAILMFHPDYKPLDEHGEPIPLPEDRVVPPEMAPPSMPVEMLDVPESQVPMIEVPEHPSDADPAP